MNDAPAVAMDHSENETPDLYANQWLFAGSEWVDDVSHWTIIEILDNEVVNVLYLNSAVYFDNILIAYGFPFKIVPTFDNPGEHWFLFEKYNGIF